MWSPPAHPRDIGQVRTCCVHLSGLELADPGVDGKDLEIDLLIGSDHYWKVVTGRIVRGDNGPTAIETRLGWVLSGPSEDPREQTAINFVSAHSSHICSLQPHVESRL